MTTPLTAISIANRPATYHISYLSAQTQGSQPFHLVPPNDFTVDACTSLIPRPPLGLGTRLTHTQGF